MYMSYSFSLPRTQLTDSLRVGPSASFFFLALVEYIYFPSSLPARQSSCKIWICLEYTPQNIVKFLQIMVCFITQSDITISRSVGHIFLSNKCII